MSFFIFGARSTGKSTLLRSIFPDDVSLFFDLLEPETSFEFVTRPEALKEKLLKVSSSIQWVVLDEVQKAPALLDVVHGEIFKGRFKFALSGSSARKLKHGRADLLAGRALVYNLFPLTHLEMGDDFDLDRVLALGSLPLVQTASHVEESRGLLRAYATTYLKEEILVEQLVRKAASFRNFLQVAAQCNGTILNFSRIAGDTGVDYKTVQQYYEILEDTLIGFRLPAFHRSIRKRQRVAPKFYLFDLGVKRACEGTLNQGLMPETHDYGLAFEHFIILEAWRLNAYFNRDYRFSYLRTKDNMEVDLIMERPGLPLALVEIKSSRRPISEVEVGKLARVRRDLPDAEAYILCLEKMPRLVEGVNIMPWRPGLEALGLAGP